MLTEDQKLTLHENLRSLSGISYEGVDFTGEVYRAYDNFELTEPCAILTFLPGSGRVVGVSSFMGFRENPKYRNYGYIENETCVLAVFAEDTNGIRGRRIADAWLRQLETYIKNNWNTLLNNASVRRESFVPYREIPEMFTDRLYGLETRFEIVSKNYWSDEPISGAEDASEVEYIYLTDTPTTGEGSGMINLWIE